MSNKRRNVFNDGTLDVDIVSAPPPPSGTVNVDIIAQTLSPLSTVENSGSVFPQVWLENPETTSFSLGILPAAADMTINGVGGIVFGAKRGAGTPQRYVSSLTIRMRGTAGALDPSKFASGAALAIGIDVAYDNGAASTIARSGMTTNADLIEWAGPGNWNMVEGTALNSYIFTKRFAKPLKLVTLGAGLEVIIRDDLSAHAGLTVMDAYMDAAAYV